MRTAPDQAAPPEPEEDDGLPPPAPAEGAADARMAAGDKADALDDDPMECMEVRFFHAWPVGMVLWSCAVCLFNASQCCELAPSLHEVRDLTDLCRVAETVGRALFRMRLGWPRMRLQPRRLRRRRLWLSSSGIRARPLPRLLRTRMRTMAL